MKATPDPAGVACILPGGERGVCGGGGRSRLHSEVVGFCWLPHSEFESAPEFRWLHQPQEAYKEEKRRGEAKISMGAWLIG